MRKSSILLFALAAAQLVLLTSCNQDPAQMAGQWELFRFGESEENYTTFGKDATPPRTATITVTVNEDKKGFSYSFNSILNTFEGAYAINNDSSLSPVGDTVSTAVSGSDEDMQLDDELGKSVTALKGWLVGKVDAGGGTEKDALILISEEQKCYLVFTKM